MKYILFVLFLLNTTNIFSQEFGGNPAKVKWQQIETDSIRVIFPKGMEDAAKRIVQNASVIQNQDKSSLGSEQKKINLVLQNGKTISNAYVGLAPWRSEFYTTAPQDPFILGAFNWIDNLTIHETRHVQQYSNFNKGFSGFAAVILGEQGRALANAIAIAIPDWFFEGDAVYNETKFSPQGRGKLPFFQSAATAQRNHAVKQAQRTCGPQQQAAPVERRALTVGRQTAGRGGGDVTKTPSTTT